MGIYQYICIIDFMLIGYVEAHMLVTHHSQDTIASSLETVVRSQ